MRLYLTSMPVLSTQTGKLCLEDEALAKKCIAAFAKELETSDSPVVRNNVMVRLPLSLSLSCLAGLRRKLTCAFGAVTIYTCRSSCAISAFGTHHWWTDTCPTWPRACATKASWSDARRCCSSHGCCRYLTSRRSFFSAIVTAGRSSYQCSGQSRVQEDYVKWKGPLFYRFVVALVDESPAVRQFGESSTPHKPLLLPSSLQPLMISRVSGSATPQPRSV